MTSHVKLREIALRVPHLFMCVGSALLEVEAHRVFRERIGERMTKYPSCTAFFSASIVRALQRGWPDRGDV